MVLDMQFDLRAHFLRRESFLTSVQFRSPYLYCTFYSGDQES